MDRKSILKLLKDNTSNIVQQSVSELVKKSKEMRDLSDEMYLDAVTKLPKTIKAGPHTFRLDILANTYNMRRIFLLESPKYKELEQKIVENELLIDSTRVAKKLEIDKLVYNIVLKGADDEIIDAVYKLLNI